MPAHTAGLNVDRGPQGGDGGGRIVATGTPEMVAKEKDSYTGQFLKGLFKRRPGSEAKGKPAEAAE